MNTSLDHAHARRTHLNQADEKDAPLIKRYSLLQPVIRKKPSSIIHLVVGVLNNLLDQANLFVCR